VICHFIGNKRRYVSHLHLFVHSKRSATTAGRPSNIIHGSASINKEKKSFFCCCFWFFPSVTTTTKMDKRHQYFTYPLDGKRQHLRVKQLVVATPQTTENQMIK
jgi:hypothetical protein